MPIPTINSFRLSHEAILSVVAQIQPLTRSYIVVKPLLVELRERIALYFNRQDKEFYDELRIFFAEERSVIKILDFIELDLKDFKIKFLIFFEKHTGEMGAINSRNFLKEHREFTGAIMARLKLEEDHLLPLVGRIAEK